ncbi:uncharacterized protein LOC122522556 [Polistes fuscatus]|uniref:uncharacterized protein LOC122522556 n=1 Tax=Polistes fuscatus TaxID=30207 RepID=UPI001CA9E2A7|nr:uncharacterized protein LOC122522556 [Polistes fuscatus]
MLWIVIHFINILLVAGRSIENEDTIHREFPDYGCNLSIKYKYGDLKEPQPLILTRNGTVSNILYPNLKGMLKMQTGQSIYMACPGETNFVKKTKYLKEVKATCVRNQIFNVNGENTNFSSLTCHHLPENMARRTNSWCYDDKSAHVEIGFNLTTGFLRIIELCRNEETYNTYYTKFRMTKWIDGYQRSYPRPWKWTAGDYFGKIDINGQYVYERQLQTLAKLLNSTELAKTHLNKTEQFLSRGHLTAKADFVYGAMQSLTFWFLNAAPQWMSFNSGNWEELEWNVKKFASNRSLDLDVYTGVHGQMTMPNNHGKQQDIYLYVNGTTKAVPVPKFYWKIIHDPQTKKGTAFVGLNHPFIKSITEDIYICKDISSTIKWLTWKPKDIKKGISYACTVDDLRKAVPTIPKFQTFGVLI